MVPTSTAYRDVNVREDGVLRLGAGVYSVRRLSIQEDARLEITGPVDSFKHVGDALKKAGIKVDDAGLRMQAKQDIELSPEESLQVMHFIEGLEEMDDVQSVAYNLKISDEALAQITPA